MTELSYLKGVIFISIELLKTITANYLPYIILIGATTLTTIVGNLRTITMLKSANWRLYLFTLIDAFLFGFVIKNMSNGDNIGYILSYALGRVFGTFIVNKVEEKVLQPVYLIHLYIPDAHIEYLEHFMHDMNWSFTRYKGYFKDTKRSNFSIHLNATQRDILLNKLKELDIEDPTIDIIELKKVFGFIKKRTQNTQE